jgi:hypothetical protein
MYHMDFVARHRGSIGQLELILDGNASSEEMNNIVFGRAIDHILEHCPNTSILSIEIDNVYSSVPAKDKVL